MLKQMKIHWNGDGWLNENNEPVTIRTDNASGNFKAHNGTMGKFDGQFFIVLMSSGTPQYLNVFSLDLATDVPWIYVEHRYIEKGAVAVEVPNTDWETIRSRYSIERYHYVEQGLRERLLIHVGSTWPEVVRNNQAYELSRAIYDNLTLRDTHGSKALTEQLQELEMDTPLVRAKIFSIQSTLSLILLQGSVQTPWERGEDIAWYTG